VRACPRNGVLLSATGRVLLCWFTPPKAVVSSSRLSLRQFNPARRCRRRPHLALDDGRVEPSRAGDGRTRRPGHRDQPPRRAHQRAAGTEVIADLLVLRRRAPRPDHWRGRRTARPVPAGPSPWTSGWRTERPASRPSVADRELMVGRRLTLLDLPGS
jgi:hypothetical protein